jgi:hypothetical protein
VLFSREDVSNHINQNFEPAWEMVRPVPIIRIDFGNGNVTTRTLHGNVASYICTADGNIADILPGIYTPAAYTAALREPRELVGTLSRLEPAARLNPWREYHRQKAANLQLAAARAAVAVRQPARIPDVGKGRIELPIERVFVAPPAPPGRRPRNAAELANWQPLAADTRLNENERRLLIHDHLVNSSFVRPEQIKTWLYREVLHADLEDPTMGIGEDFFADLER